MPIPADFTLRAGRFVHDATKQVQYFCNCPGSRATLARLAAERHAWTPEAMWKQQQAEQQNAQSV